MLPPPVPSLPRATARGALPLLIRRTPPSRPRPNTLTPSRSAPRRNRYDAPAASPVIPDSNVLCSPPSNASASSLVCRRPVAARCTPERQRSPTPTTPGLGTPRDQAQRHRIPKNYIFLGNGDGTFKAATSFNGGNDPDEL